MSALHDIDPRVAVLEQIAKDTAAVLLRIEADLTALRAFQWSQFRWLAGIMLGGFGALLLRGW